MGRCNNCGAYELEKPTLRRAYTCQGCSNQLTSCADCTVGPYCSSCQKKMGGPEITLVCCKGSCLNEIGNIVFCSEHQQSLDNELTQNKQEISKLEEQIIKVLIRLEFWNDLITNRHK